MKKIIVSLKAVLIAAAVMAYFTPESKALELFQDTNVSVTTKLAPQYLGYMVVNGTSTAGTAYKYYKVSANVPQIGETKATPVMTVPLYDGGMTSTNSIRIVWAPVEGATSYNLYKSVDNSAFSLLGSVATVTLIDYGQALGAAYSAPSPRGGSLNVENNATVGGNITAGGYTVVSGVSYMGSATAIRGTITPLYEGGVIFDATSHEVCVSTGVTSSTWVKQLDGTTACAH